MDFRVVCLERVYHCTEALKLFLLRTDHDCTMEDGGVELFSSETDLRYEISRPHLLDFFEQFAV